MSPPKPRGRAPGHGCSVGGVLAAVALVLALTCGVLRWPTSVAGSKRQAARDEAVQAAKEITGQMLSYETETVDQQLTAARDRMTGDFRGTYTAMINEVIPAAHASADRGLRRGVAGRGGEREVRPRRIGVVRQPERSGGKPHAAEDLSVARVTMVKDGDRWLMSEY